MATKTAAPEQKSAYEYQYRKDYQQDWAVHQNWVQTLDPLEAMLIGQVFDSVSGSIDGAKITDSYTTTLAIERAARVMGKLPDGNTEASKADQGKAAFMDILRQKWIYPNANSQYPFEIKMELAQLYSDVYGYMPVFYDWNVSPTGYVGPDCWLWNPRNLVFQQGRNFFNDMEYVTALTWVSKKFLQGILDNETEGDGWDRDALQELIELADTVSDPDPQQDTQVARTRVPQATKKGICLATRYESGDDGNWCTFAPDHAYVQVREIPNPHQNGRIPFRLKYSQELYDSVYGLGDFARSKPLQFARDGLTNFYFKGIKMNLIPPIVVNANGVLKHTIDYREGAVMMETLPNSVRRLETSPAGLATYQGTQTALTGSLLSLWGSQNAAAPAAETLNPSQGKTPAAISLYSDKEADRDGRARKRLENLIEELTDAFYSLIAHIGTETIPVSIFSKDLEEIEKSGLGDVGQLFKNFQPNESFTGGELQIDPKALRDVEFRFNIDFGSTAAINKQQQRQEMENLMGNIAKFQNQFKDDPSIAVNWGAIMKAYEALSDVPGASEFVTLKNPQQVQQEQQQAAQAQQQPQKSPVESLNYKDAPPDIQRQIEQQAGLQPSQMQSPATTQQALAHSQIISNHKQGQQAQASHELATAQAQTQALQSAEQANQPEPPQEPTFAGGGAYSDPLAAAAAEHLSKL